MKLKFMEVWLSDLLFFCCVIYVNCFCLEYVEEVKNCFDNFEKYYMYLLYKY